MPVLPLYFNKQKVLSRKHKRRKKGKLEIRAFNRRLRSKKRYIKDKKRFKLFSKKRMYFSLNKQNLIYPKFFAKKKRLRKVSTFNIKSKMQFRKALIKKTSINKKIVNESKLFRKFVKGKYNYASRYNTFFKRSSLKIGPLERRLMVNDLTSLDLVGYYSKVNLILGASSNKVKHPLLSKKKNFRRSVFMLRFFKGIDYNLIRSNVEVSKFLNSGHTSRLWRRSKPSMLFKRILLRQLNSRFRRAMTNLNHSYNELEPLSFDTELEKFRRSTLSLSRSDIN